jgi:hypothetical protein
MTESWTAEQHAAKAEELVLSPSSSLERSVTAIAHVQIASFKAAAEAMKLARGVMERQEPPRRGLDAGR